MSLRSAQSRSGRDDNGDRAQNPLNGDTRQPLTRLTFSHPLRNSRRVRVGDKGLSLRLLADAQLADDVAVAVRIVRLEIIEQATALADEHEKATAGRMVLGVGLEVLGELANAFAQDRNLHFRTAGVGVVSAEAGDNFGFLLRCQHGKCVTPVAEFCSFTLPKCLQQE